MPLPGRKEYDSNIETKEFYLPKEKNDGIYLVKFSQTLEWQRVNVSLLDNDKNLVKRFPKWDEMCEVKEKLFDSKWTAIEIHNGANCGNVIKDDYSIDIWMPLTKELELPPSILIGTKKKIFTKKFK